MVDVNGYLALQQMLDVNKTFQLVDFPVQDFGTNGSVKFREVITDIQHETYRRCDPSALSLTQLSYFYMDSIYKWDQSLQFPFLLFTP